MLEEHTIRFHMRKTTYLNLSLLHACFTFYRLARYVFSCQILLSFHLTMMAWSYRNVV